MIVYHQNINQNLCNLLIKKFDELNSKNIISQKKIDDVRIFGFERVLKKNISNLFFDIDTKASLKFFNRRPVYQTLMVNKIFRNSKKLGPGSGGGWHRDSYIKNQMKTIYYLTDVNIENGPFTYLEPKSNKFCRFYPIGTRFDKNVHHKLNFCSNETSITSKNPGLGFSIITNYIHRGMPLRKKYRYAITVYSSIYGKLEEIDNLKVKP